MAEQLPSARVLCLSPTVPLLSTGPRKLEEGSFPVWHFSPDQPLPTAADARFPLPGSSSLEMAVRATSAPVVFLDAGTEVARHVLPLVQDRAWAVHEAEASVSEAARALGSRLLPLRAGQEEATVLRLVEALRSSGETHAR